MIVLSFIDCRLARRRDGPSLQRIRLFNSALLVWQQRWSGWVSLIILHPRESAQAGSLLAHRWWDFHSSTWCLAYHDLFVFFRHRLSRLSDWTSRLFLFVLALKKIEIIHSCRHHVCWAIFRLQCLHLQLAHICLLVGFSQILNVLI
jgi:hypothetical protein